MSRKFEPQLPLSTGPRALARYYDRQASGIAGNNEVSDRLLPEVLAKQVATWNLAVGALAKYGRPVLIEKHGGPKKDRRFMPRSTGLIELAGSAGEAEVRVMRLSTMSGRRPKEVSNLENYTTGIYDASILAQTFTIRPLAAIGDPDSEGYSHVSETYLPATMSRLPQTVLAPSLMAKRAGLHVAAKPLTLYEGEYGRATSTLLMHPHLPLDHWDVGTEAKVEAEVQSQTERVVSQLAAYSLIGTLTDPLRENPDYQ